MSPTRQVTGSIAAGTLPGGSTAAHVLRPAESAGGA